MGLCEYLIKQDILKQEQDEQKQKKIYTITLVELTEIIYNLLFDAYYIAEREAYKALENKITHSKDLGIDENITKSDLLKGCQKVVLSDRYCICTIIRNNNIRIFETFSNIDKKNTILSCLAQKTAEIYYNDMTYKTQLFDVENRHGFVSDQFYNGFIEAFLHYRFIEILNKKESDKPQQNIIPDNILNELEEKKIIKKEPFKWLKSSALFAYFVEIACDKYNLKHGKNRKLKPLADLFSVTSKSISDAINDYKNKGDLPIGYEIIDEIMK